MENLLNTWGPIPIRMIAIGIKCIIYQYCLKCTLQMCMCQDARINGLRQHFLTLPARLNKTRI
jgi:hypothetical protein